MLFHLNVCNKGSPAIRSRLLVLLAASSLNLFIAASAHAADYYMSPSGNDSNPGTLAAPWKSFDRLHAAQKILKPGDTVYFRGGDYVMDDSAGRKYYPLPADGTASAPLVYRNYQGEKPVLIFDRRVFNHVDSWGVMIYLSGNYVIVDGLTFRQTEESRARGLVGTEDYTNRPMTPTAISTYSSNVTIRNCSIENFSGLGVFQGDSSRNLLIENCRVTGMGSHGFYIAGQGGTFRYNYMDGSRQYKGGRTIQIQYKSSIGNKIYGNLLVNGSADSVVFSGQISHNEVFNNVIINGGSGRESGYAVGFWCEDGPMGPGNKFYNNTVIGRSMGGMLGTFDPSPTSKCRGTPPMQAVDIYNNIFYPSTPVRALAGNASYPKLRNNIFYNIRGSVPPGNTLINPNLANPNGTKSADAMLQDGSPAIDKAPSGAPALDYQSGKRPVGAAADIGAFEFGAPPGNGGGPLGGGSFPPSGPVLLGPNGEVCPTGYLPSQ